MLHVIPAFRGGACSGDYGIHLFLVPVEIIDSPTDILKLSYSESQTISCQALGKDTPSMHLLVNGSSQQNLFEVNETNVYLHEEKYGLNSATKLEARLKNILENPTCSHFEEIESGSYQCYARNFAINENNATSNSFRIEILRKYRHEFYCFFQL